jgi:hypothetical protein
MWDACAWQWLPKYMPQQLAVALQYADGNITVWRWLMLVGLLVPSYWIGEGLAQLIEAVIEWNLFENRRVLYYFIGTTVGSCRCCALRRSCHHSCPKRFLLLTCLTEQFPARA